MKNTYKEVDIFLAQARGEVDAKAPELAEARETIKDLSAKYVDTKDKGIRTELAEITTVVANEILRKKTQYIELFGDVKRTKTNERVQFEIERDLTSAEFTAKGVAGDRGTVIKEYTSMATEFVTTRPYIAFLDLASGRISFDSIAAKSAEKMEFAIVNRLETTMFNAFSAMAAPNYGTAAGVAPAVIDPMIDAFGRFGPVSVVGDQTAVGAITTIGGWVPATLPEALAIEYNRNGHIGTYHTANVVKMTNPFRPNTLNNTALRQDLLYILTSGDESRRSLKVQFEGDMIMRENEDFKTGDYEMMMGIMFGAAVVGAEHYMGIYRIQ